MLRARLRGSLRFMLIRPAEAREAEALTALVLRSKAHWGYDEAFMKAAVPELTILASHLTGNAAFVANDEARLLGFYILNVETGVPTLRDLWVEPGLIGTGVGGALWRHMLGEARRLAYASVRIESDPNAAPFYRKMGARETGSVRSTVIEGRVLPVFEIALP